MSHACTVTREVTLLFRSTSRAADLYPEGESQISCTSRVNPLRKTCIKIYVVVVVNKPFPHVFLYSFMEKFGQPRRNVTILRILGEIYSFKLRDIHKCHGKQCKCYFT